MGKRSVRASRGRIDLAPIIEGLGEALCVIEVSINSLESGDHGPAGPELPALQCALKSLSAIYAQLAIRGAHIERAHQNP